MNRRERRQFLKQAKQDGIDKNVTNSYITFKEGNIKEPSVIPEITEGMSVKINIDKIKSQPDYEDKMNPNYKEFIESNINNVFTAHIEKNGLISLEGILGWLFWKGDLIPVDNNKGYGDEI